MFVQADRARIVGNDISGGYRDRNLPCVLLDGVHGVVVEANRVHDCTRSGRRDLYSAGIHVASAVRARVAHNVVFHTLGDGIALGPNAQRTRVTRNLVDGNVSGIYIGGDARTASSHNAVTRNVISNSGDWSVHSAWDGRRGGGDVVSSNCLWNGFRGHTAGTGFAVWGNIVARPRYVARPRNFTMRSGPCLPMHPHIVETRVARLPAFRVGVPPAGAAAPDPGRRVDADRPEPRRARRRALHTRLPDVLVGTSPLGDARPAAPARRVAGPRRSRRGPRPQAVPRRPLRTRHRRRAARRRSRRPRLHPAGPEEPRVLLTLRWRLMVGAGTTIAGYRIERRLGSGGMGVGLRGDAALARPRRLR